MTLERTRQDGCLSDYLLDHLINDELDAGQQVMANAHLVKCTSCATRLEAMKTGRDAFRENPPRLELGSRRKSSRGRTWMLAPAGAFVVLIAMAIWLSLPADESPGVRSKGKPSLGFFVKHDASVRQGSFGDVVYPEDRLRFFYSWDRPGYLAIFSVDGRGRVSVYYPHGNKAVSIHPGEKVALDESAVLDDALGAEMFLGYFCDHEVELSRLKKAVANHPESATIPLGCTVDTFTVIKQKRSP